MIPVKDMILNKKMSANELICQMYDAGGFTAKKIGEGVNILESMVKEGYKISLSFPACIIAAGTRGIIKEMVKHGIVNLIMTTCGTLDHDMARNWKNYYHGSFLMDDVELHRRKVNRLGNILVPNESYGTIIEEKMQELLGRMIKEKNEWGTREICWEMGKMLGEESILYWAWKRDVPVYVPGITDGAVGSQIWMFSQYHPFKIDLLKDEKELADIFFNDKEKMGALIIGGGISKHHLIWWNQFRGGLDSTVYITSSPEWDGSLSGARIREGISWGKLKEESKHVTIEGDATAILPLMAAALLERLDIE
ncbi:MAG: deoxyhypusine synthase [Candidatus Thermoplasmatota archaeon]|nr:deoxyhypusine synthase [Candidatus Thermoplasmatota archaeon]